MPHAVAPSPDDTTELPVINRETRLEVPEWKTGSWEAGELARYGDDDLIYQAIVRRTSADTDNPEDDTTGWRSLGMSSDFDGTIAFSQVTGKIAASQIPDNIISDKMIKEFAITDDKLAKQTAHDVMKYDAAGVANAGRITAANITDDQITKQKFVTSVRDSLAKADAALARADAVMLVDALPNPIPAADTVLVLRDPIDDHDEGLYTVKEHTGAYYEGGVTDASDSVIAVQANLDHNPNGSVSEIEWTVNGLHMYVEFAADAFTGEPPANLYLEATHVDTGGATIGAADALSNTDKTNSRITLARFSQFDRNGHFSYGNQLSGATMLFWGGVDAGERLRFQVYTDSGYSTALVAAGGKYYDLITDNKFPHQFVLSRIEQAGATNGQVMAWSDTANKWGPATFPAILAGTREPKSSDGVDGDFWIAGLGNGNILSVWENVSGNWVELARADDDSAEIGTLQHLTRDLHIGQVITEWEDMDDSEVDMTWAVVVNGAITLLDTDFDNQGASLTIPASTSPRTTYLFARLPAATDHTRLRVHLLHDDSFSTANHWGLAADEGVTVPANDTYQYWMTVINLNETAALSFQMQDRATLSETRFDGKLGGEALKQLGEVTGTAGAQGAFYFRLYNVDVTDKPTAGTYDVDADTFTVTPNTWKHQVPVAAAGERITFIEAPIDPRNDAGKTIDLTDAGRWGAVAYLTGAAGPEGTVQAGLALEKVGETVTLATSVVNGPMISLLSDVVWLSFRYTRANIISRFNTLIPKSEFDGVAAGSAYPLQMQGAGGAKIDLYDVGGALTFGGYDGNSYSLVTVEIYNTKGGNKGDPDPTAAAAAAAAQATADAALPLAGGTMTGKITLDAAPVDDLHAATKKYVDDNAGMTSATDQTARDAAKAAKDVADAALPLAGGTMTGKITLDGAPTDNLHAANKKYVDDKAGSGGGRPLKEFETLPDPDTYEVGEIIAANDEFHILGITDADSPNLYQGTVGTETFRTTGGEQWRGIANDQSPNGFSTDGDWTANPGNAISILLADNERHLRVAIKKSVYETAKGSDFTPQDHIAIKVTYPDGDTDEAVMANYNSYQRDTDYVIWQHRHPTANYNLFSEDAGNAIQVEFFTVDTSLNPTTTHLLTHPVSEKHWLDWYSGDDHGLSALRLAQANSARLDALDVDTDTATPNQTESFDATNVTFSHTAFSHSFNNTQPNDLIVLTWENFRAWDHAFEHTVPGSTDAKGRLYLHVKNLSTTFIGGSVGKVTGINRIASDQSDDTLFSRLSLDMERAGNGVVFRLSIDTSGNANDVAMIPPANMHLQVDIYRGTDVDSVINPVHGRLGDLSFRALTAAQYTALATKEPKTLYIVPEIGA